MTRLERHADKVAYRLASTTRECDSSIDQLERGRLTLGQPFPHAGRLTELSARLAELTPHSQRSISQRHRRLRLHLRCRSDDR